MGLSKKYESINDIATANYLDVISGLVKRKDDNEKSKKEIINKDSTKLIKS